MQKENVKSKMENFAKYDRTLTPRAEESLSKIAEKVSSNSVVLDVGCSTGMLGRYLSLEKGCTVDGVDIDIDALQRCEHVYRKLACKNLEREDLTDVFEQGAYDFIVVADIVEHLIDPDRLFSQLKLLVKPHGSIIFSIPNITHVAAALELLLGNFEYKQNGLLDSTHVRFYSYQNIVERLMRSSLYVWEVDTVRKEIEETEFGNQQSKLFPRSWLNALIEHRSDALVYQWIFSTKIYPPLNNIEKPVLVNRVKNRPFYISALYWDDDHRGGFSESKKIDGVQQSQTDDEWRISFCFNNNSQESISQLRIDPISDQKMLWIKKATITNELNQTIWEWIPKNESDKLINAVWIDMTADSGRILVPTNDDPQWYPEIPVEVLQGINASSNFSFVMVANQEVINANLVKAQRMANSHDAMRNDQIANLTHAVAVRDGQINSMAAMIEEIFRSNSWRLTAPLRWFGKQRQRLSLFWQKLPSVRARASGLPPPLQPVSQVGSYPAPHYAPLNLPMKSGLGTKGAKLPRVAVHIHVHYTDLLDELLEDASHLPGEPDIFVTTTQPVESIVGRVQARFPRATVWQPENRGKDLGPFIDALQRHQLDEYDLVLKLHGKKSLNRAEYLKAVQALFGNVIRNGDDWRRGLIRPLTANQKRVTQIYQAFAADATLGMVGAARFICRAPDADESGYELLCRRLAVSPYVLFFGGTMFWIRGRHLSHLRKAGLTLQDFGVECVDNVENTLEHSCERVFGTLVAADGGWIGGVE